MIRKESLGQFISMRRAFMRLTQEDLAERIGVSKSAVAKWETDGGIPERDNLRRLSEVMNVSVDDLHRIIDGAKPGKTDMEINITSEVIAIFESYGYRILRPGEDRMEGLP